MSPGNDLPSDIPFSIDALAPSVPPHATVNDSGEGVSPC